MSNRCQAEVFRDAGPRCTDKALPGDTVCWVHAKVRDGCARPPQKRIKLDDVWLGRADFSDVAEPAHVHVGSGRCHLCGAEYFFGAHPIELCSRLQVENLRYANLRFTECPADH
jgi:hypothetical protein